MQDSKIISISILTRLGFRDVTDVDVKEHRREASSVWYSISQTSRANASSIADLKHKASICQDAA